ncbi:MAG: TetR family transcriptional regulator C-terminal domain-containing protein [Bacteroidota bacterium]
MATTKSPSQKNKRSSTNLNDKITKAYREYILTHGHEPPSVFQFMKGLKVAEDEFYKHYASFESVKKHVWKHYVADTIQVLHQDKAYSEYSVREKLLSFYYTLMEVLKKDRSYVLVSLKELKKTDLSPKFLSAFKTEFKEYIDGLVAEGLETEEIVKRPLITDRYYDGLWLQLMFVINFWIKDDSANFEKTDAAIEKSVNLSFELMGKGPLDTMVDFAKFLYQNR